MKALTLFDLPWNIAEHVTVDPDSGCWRGTGLRHDRDGYAHIGSQLAHRFTWQLLVGDIPADRPILDHVRKRGCVWRDCLFIGHLEPVTRRENTMRGRSFAVVNYLKTNCGTCGEPFDLLNTYYYKGRRDCRSCIRRRVREYQARERARTARLRREWAEQIGAAA